MGKRCVLFMVLLLLPLLHAPPSVRGAAQPYTAFIPGLIWATWGGRLNDSGSDVATDTAGNMYVVGTTESFGAGQSDALLLKYNANGSFLWARTWGGASMDTGKGVAVDSFGQVYITGDTLSFSGNSTVFLVKFDPNGYLIWQRMLEGNGAAYVKGIMVDSGGNILLSGETAGFGAGQRELFLIKIVSSGVVEWAQTWGETGHSAGAGVTSDPSGNIYLTGYSQPFGMNQSAVLLKFNATGDIVWQKAWNGTSGEEGVGIARDDENNTYVTGSTATSTAGGKLVMLMKFNSTGGVLWQKTANITGTDVGLGIGVNSEGRIFVSGSTNRAFYCGNRDGFLLEMNASAGLISEFEMGSYDCYSNGVENEAQGLAIDTSGNAISTGFTDWLQPVFESNKTSIRAGQFTFQTSTTPSRELETQLVAPNGRVSSPTGLQDQFDGSGSRDLLLLKYFVHPASYPVKFTGSLVPFGSLEYGFNGTGNYTEGTYIAREPLLLCLCDFVGGWNSTGGVVAVNRNNNYETAVVITGPGTLTSPHLEIEYYPYEKHPDLPPSFLLILLVFALPVLFSVRRRQISRR